MKALEDGERILAMNVLVRRLNAVLVLVCVGTLVARVLGLLDVSWWLIAGLFVFTYLVWPGIGRTIAERYPSLPTGRERDAEAAFLQGVKQLDAADNLAALQAFDRGLDIVPDNVPLLNNRAYALAALGRQAEALTTFQESLKLAPTSVDAWSGCGTCLAEMGRYEEALDCYSKCLTRHPRAGDYFNHGHTLVALKRFDEAVTSLDRALALEPNLLGAKQVKAIALARAGLPQQALRLFQAVVVARPTEPSAFFNVGKALSDLGRHEAAVVYFERAIELNDSDADAWNNKGYSLEQLGRTTAAIEAYRRCLALEPDHAVARGNMTRMRET